MSICLPTFTPVANPITRATSPLTASNNPFGKFCAPFTRLYQFMDGSQVTFMNGYSFEFN